MSDGGINPWKVQTIKLNGPVGDYSKLREPLLPPKGKTWHQDEATKEWQLVDKNTQQKQDNEVAAAVVIESDEPLSCSPLLKKDAVKGIHYLEHEIQPTDTFQGICLTYRITGTKLRQVNMFSGTNLKLAPSKLIIPVETHPDGKTTIDAYHIRKAYYNSKEGKVHAFLAEFFPSLKPKEAKYYLEMTDYNLEQAIVEAREDLEWEKNKD